MDVLRELSDFYEKFDGDKGVTGYTARGLPIYFFSIVKSSTPVVLVQYGIHAREYVTTYLALRQIDDFRRRGKKGAVYFIPAVNPEGIAITKVLPLYKANGNGVDLNVNFDADWGTGTSNVFIRSSENYVGKSPFSERETSALRDFTLAVAPDVTVSYHSKGEEIYYAFSQDKKRLKRDKNIAEKLSDVTGYSLKFTVGSAGGYKDWCIDKLKIPALTVEVGDDGLSHPIGRESVDEIFDKNKDVLKTLTEKIKWKNLCVRR